MEIRAEEIRYWIGSNFEWAIDGNFVLAWSICTSWQQNVDGSAIAALGLCCRAKMLGKGERIQRSAYNSREEARQDVFDCIEMLDDPV